MFCPFCGSHQDENLHFCKDCGADISSVIDEQTKKRKRKTAVRKTLNEGQRISEHIILCDDGKYRWNYDLNLLKNPVIYFLIWKIFFFIILGIFIFVFIADAFRDNLDFETIIDNLKFCGYFMIGMTIVTALGYLIYAAIMGGKYSVIFEMDENGITHKQIPEQAKKAMKISRSAFVAGALTGNLSTMGAGLNSARSEMSSDFKIVRKVKVRRKFGLIKVNELFEKNQVYAYPEDFDFVLNYILDRVPESARPKKNK